MRYWLCDACGRHVRSCTSCWWLSQFSDPPSLAFMPVFPALPPACASSLPDSLCFDACFLTKLLLLSLPAPYCHPFYALVFCSTDYSSKSVTSLQYLLWVQHALPNAMKSWASRELCLFLLIGTTLARIFHPFMFLLQAIFGCKWSLSNWISHFLLFLCICGNYQILTCGIFKYTPFILLLCM